MEKFGRFSVIFTRERVFCKFKFSFPVYWASSERGVLWWKEFSSWGGYFLLLEKTSNEKGGKDTLDKTSLLSVYLLPITSSCDTLVYSSSILSINLDVFFLCFWFVCEFPEYFSDTEVANNPHWRYENQEVPVTVQLFAKQNAYGTTEKSLKYVYSLLLSQHPYLKSMRFFLSVCAKINHVYK